MSPETAFDLFLILAAMQVVVAVIVVGVPVWLVVRAVRRSRAAANEQGEGGTEA